MIQSLGVPVLTVSLALCAVDYAEGKTPPNTKIGSSSNQAVRTPKSRSDREHYLTARALAGAGLYEDAIHEVNVAISINPTERSYHDLLGFCLESLKRYDEAIRAFTHAILLDPSDVYARRHLSDCNASNKIAEKATSPPQQSFSLKPVGEEGERWLGYKLNELHRSDESSNAAKAAEFETNYRTGIRSFRAKQFDEASRFLAKAVDLRPDDFNSNFWRGMSLMRARKFKEAISNFEKAHKIKDDDKITRLELFACYLATQQIQKASSIFPLIVGAAAGGLTFIYFVMLALLLPFSLPIRTSVFPGLWFSIAWLLLFIEGQIAFLLLLPLLHWPSEGGSALIAAVLAGLPIILVAATGFARQPWGRPFQWPVRFGTPKVLAASVSLLFLTVLIGAVFSQLYVELTHKPFPLQRVVPLIKDALQVNPMTAWLAVALAIPVVEEILFRGLLFGALEKYWGVKGAILATSFLFVCFHLQLVGFFYLLCIGLILGWARWRTGSLGLPMLIHALNNSLAMVALTLQRT